MKVENSPSPVYHSVRNDLQSLIGLINKPVDQNLGQATSPFQHNYETNTKYISTIIVSFNEGLWVLYMIFISQRNLDSRLVIQHFKPLLLKQFIVWPIYID